MKSAFFEVLGAAGPHESLGAEADTYGRVIGSWQGELTDHFTSKTATRRSVEAHFSWVLEGRAVQDVWITPVRGERTGGQALPLDWYGCTLRIYDPTAKLWRVTWSDPAAQYYIQLEGRRQGQDIVQLGLRGGRPIRWIFSEIQPQSFRWQGHSLKDDGATWALEVDVQFRRMGGA